MFPVSFHNAIADFNRSIRMITLKREISDRGTVFQFDHPDCIPYPLLRMFKTSLQHFFIRCDEDFIGLCFNKALHFIL